MCCVRERSLFPTKVVWSVAVVSSAVNGGLLGGLIPEADLGCLSNMDSVSVMKKEVKIR